MFEFKPPATEIDIQHREDIVLDGQIIGWVEVLQSNGDFRVHAGIYLAGVGIHRELIQGFGATKEAAVRAALLNNRDKYTRAISGIDDIASRISA